MPREDVVSIQSRAPGLRRGRLGFLLLALVWSAGVTAQLALRLASCPATPLRASIPARRATVGRVAAGDWPPSARTDKAGRTEASVQTVVAPGQACGPVLDPQDGAACWRTARRARTAYTDAYYIHICMVSSYLGQMLAHTAAASAR